MRFPTLRGLTGFRARKDARNIVREPANTPFDTARKGGPTQDEDRVEIDSLPLPKPVPGGWRAFDEDHAAKLHAAYYDPDKKVSEVAQMFAVSTSTLLRWIDEMGWPSRRQMRQQSIAQLRDGGRVFAANHSPHPEQPREALRLEGCGASANSEFAAHPSRHDPDGPVPQDEGSATPQNIPLAEDIAATVRAELETIKTRLHDPSPGAGERNARTLASLVRTLRAVEELRAKGTDGFTREATQDGEPPARSLEELRQELIDRVKEINAGR